MSTRKCFLQLCVHLCATTDQNSSSFRFHQITERYVPNNTIRTQKKPKFHQSKKKYTSFAKQLVQIHRSTIKSNQDVKSIFKKKGSEMDSSKVFNNNNNEPIAIPQNAKWNLGRVECTQVAQYLPLIQNQIIANTPKSWDHKE